MLEINPKKYLVKLCDYFVHLCGTISQQFFQFLKIDVGAADHNNRS